MMKLNSSLFNIPIVKNILAYDSISSTNTRAKELAKRGSVDGTLVIANHQTCGKGRMGRSFISQKEDGIYMSLLLRPNLHPSKLSCLTLVTALATARAITDTCQLNVQIKWPNDIISNGKKLVGILTEAGEGYVVIGIGVNVNNQNFPDDITTTATSIFKETEKAHDIFQLITSILQEFNILYDKFISTENLSFMRETYNSLLANINNQIYLIPHEKSSTCNNPYFISTDKIEPVLCMGIDETGNLICKDDDGKISYVNSGEISLRGTSSYAK